MFGKIVSHPETAPPRSAAHSKRRHARRGDDCCVAVVNGQMHPVENWSVGGFLMTADERLYAIGQNCTVTLKFKLRDEISEIDHSAQIVRKGMNKVALKFQPLPRAVHSAFQKVVDDFVTQNFAQSQTEV